MNKFLLSLIFLAVGNAVSAQTTLYYNFNNSLNEANGSGRELTVLGTRGNFVTDTLTEIQGTNKTVYRFEKNNGVQFNNTASGNFLGETFTIELYFVFDELSSWKRVADWKNRKTDNGAYVYNGQVNFYPHIYSDSAPVAARQYTYYVITRDSATKNVLIYVDAEIKVNSTDSNNDAVINEDGVLNLFYDDLTVQDEASSGAVAMLRLYNYALDSTAVKEKWERLGSSVLGIGKAANSEEPPATGGIENLLAKSGRVDVYGIYFDLNSATIKPESEPVLKEISDALAKNPAWKLSVEGHTDNEGADASNMVLSRNRAASVKQALVTRFGIAGDRLAPAGFGASRPKEPNGTLKGRARNRRVELVRQ